MPISSLVTTPGAANANAYCDLAFAEQYHLDRPAESNTWKDAYDSNKTQAILLATKLLDRLVSWSGSVVSETQALLWPRYGMYYRNGYSIPNDIIPRDLQEATADYAARLLDASFIGTTQSTQVQQNWSQLEELAASAQRRGLQSVTTPNLSIELKDSVAEPPGKVVPAEVIELMPSHWIAKSHMMLELLRA